MCTSSIVHASSKALPFFMSGHVCHLIVFRPHMPLTLLLFFIISPRPLSHQLSFFGGVTLLSRAGVWLTEWLSRMQEEGVHIVNSWETPGRKIESLIALIPLLLSPNVDATPVFQSKCYFASDGGKIIPAGWYQEVNLWKSLTGTFNAVVILIANQGDSGGASDSQSLYSKSELMLRLTSNDTVWKPTS